MLQKFFISDPKADNRKEKQAQLRKLVPNMVTLLSIVCGLTAIQKAIGGQWETAVLLIVVAAVFDILDGALARLLKASSKFGAELDSLADFLSFGVAPAVIIHLWILEDTGRIGWVASLVFALASALRLARFNAQSDVQEQKPEWARYFFSGVPAPAGAGLVLMPLIVSFVLKDIDLSALNIMAPLISLWLIIIGALMVSRLPSFSTKQIRITGGGMIPTLMILGLLAALLINAPWLTLSVLGCIYAVSLPFAGQIYYKRWKKHNSHA